MAVFVTWGGHRDAERGQGSNVVMLACFTLVAMFVAAAVAAVDAVVSRPRLADPFIVYCPPPWQSTK